MDPGWVNISAPRAKSECQQRSALADYITMVAICLYICRYVLVPSWETFAFHAYRSVFLRK